MNIFNTLEIQSVGKEASASTDVLDILGKNLELDQNSLKLLQENGQLEGMSFDDLLKMSSENPEMFESLVDNAEAKNTKELNDLSIFSDRSEAQIEPDTKELLNQKTLIKNSELTNNNLVNSRNDFQSITNQNSNVLKVGKSEHQILNTNESSELDSLLKNTKTNETISKNTHSPEVLKAKNILENAINNQNISDEKLNLKSSNKNILADNNVEVLNNTSNTDKVKNSKLMNLNQFFANQPNSVKQRAIGQKAYRPLTESMFNKKIDSSIPEVTAAKNDTVSLQHVMFGAQEAGEQLNQDGQFSQSQTIPTKINNTNTANNVFNINNIQSSDTSEQIISKIQDYIVQSKVSGSQDVQMSFEHTELGKIDLHVQKAQNNALNISIGARSAEGSKFFAQNQSELLNSLAQAGVNVGELKLESSSSSNNQSSFENNSKNQFSQNSSRGNQSDSRQQNEDSRRREEIWSMFKDKEVA